MARPVPSRPPLARLVPALVALLALVAIALAAERLLAAREGVVAEDVLIGDTPATVFRPADGARFVADPPPAVVLAHGFAGSRKLMAPFAAAFAQNGYLAVTFDFVGHGEHPRPMRGDVDSIEGPTRAMLTQMQGVAAFARARTGGPGLAVLGHSMASDIVVRFAQEDPSVAATVAVSMFSPAVSATAPKNLLVIVGEWEGMLKREALRAVGLATAPEPAREGTTYGSFADGTARRAVFAARSEHISVLFAPESLEAAVRWADQSLRIGRRGPVVAAARLPWIGLLVLGIVALAFPLSRLLPVLARPPAGAGLGWRRLWPLVVVPPVLVPVVLRGVPTDLLPIAVGDYLAVHFLAYGLVTFALLAWRRRGAAASSGRRAVALALVSLAVTAYAVGALGLAIDTSVTNYRLVPARYPLLAVMLVGTLAYFLASEWAVRGEGAGRGAVAAERLGFVLSLGLAVALDAERLFFLVIIVPVIVLFFVIYGLMGRWSYARTGHPLPGALAGAVAFAWAISVTFPMLAG